MNIKFKNVNDTDETINSEIASCKICKLKKEKNDFYKYTHMVDNKVLKESYLLDICKSCLPIEAIYFDRESQEPKIDESIFIKHFQKLQLEQFEKENKVLVKDLIPYSEVSKILNLDMNNKNWLLEKANAGIIKEFKIKFAPERRELEITGKERFKRYFLKDEIEMMKSIKDKGNLIQRCKSSINKGIIGKHNPPYQFISKEGKQFIFVNFQDKMRICAICCEYKSFNDYHKSAKEGSARICISCTAKESKEYYKNLSPERKQTVFNQAKQWARDNKDKIKAYRKLNRKRPTTKQRIMNNLRKRINTLIQSHGNEFAYVYNTDELVKDKSIAWVGLSYNEFMDYIESKFLPGMTWENYGNGYNVDKNGKPIRDENGDIIKVLQWQIDHIKPVSAFDLSLLEERMKVNNYTNLLPMWVDDNNWKLAKTELCPVFDKEFIEKYKELEILIKKGKENANIN